MSKYWLPERFIDAHHHLWNPDTNEPDNGYVWLKSIGAMKPFGDPTPIQRDYLLDEFRSEVTISKLVASVHVQCDGAIPDPVAETRFIQDISDTSGFPIAIVGFADLASETAEETIKRHLESPNFRGVRQILSRLPDRPEISFAGEEYLINPVWRENYAVLAEYGLSFDLQCYPEQMAAFAQFASGHGDVPVIIDHAGSPHDQSPEGMNTWREGMAALAALPNTTVKLCGFGMFDRDWNAETIRPLIEHIDMVFGPGRTIFASNYPVDKLMRPYNDMLTDIGALYSTHSDSERDAVFFDNAASVYKLNQLSGFDSDLS